MLRVLGLLAALAAAILAAPAPAPAHVPDSGDAGAIAEGRRALSAPAPMALPAQRADEPAPPATPRAECGPGSKPEPGMQGRLPREEVDSGRAADGYWCNLEVIGRSGNTGGFRVHRYIDESGRECAYYDTALLFPTNATSLSGEATGVAVLDMSDPRNPKRTDTLLTPAMQSPHESVNISIQRGILAAVLGNPAAYPGGVDVFDVSKDCRHPEPLAAAFPASPFGHESGMAPDGLTFYPTSIGTNDTTAVDLTNPRLPRTIWNGKFNTHGMSTSEDGNRGYFATGDGLVIADLSEVQGRSPDPQVREISRLTWPTMTIPQVAIPVTIGGRPHVVEVDEYASNGDGVAGHGRQVGAARIIDVSDETAPRVVSNIRLDVHQPENRDAIAGDYGTQSPVQGYAAHYCNVPQRVEPGILACSMILSGLRVFDIRDPENPKEIAYYVAPPSTVSATGSSFIDERANWAMSQPAFAPERGEIWYSDGTSGFYALRMDADVWPFPAAGRSGADGCTESRGLRTAKVRNARRGVRLKLKRRRALPVEVDVFRSSRGRRVVRERRVASFDDRSGSFTWRTKRLSRGLYFARFRMRDGDRVVDARRVVFEVTRSGKVRRRPPHHRRDSCGLVRSFKLERPAFGGRRRIPLRLSYRLNAPADVLVTVTRRGKVVKRLKADGRRAGRTYRLKVPVRGLRRGDHRIKLRVTSADQQAVASLVSRRL